MPNETGGLEVEFLNINQLSYTFSSLYQTEFKEWDRSYLIDIAKELLNLMEKYNALHPTCLTLISFLEKEGVKDKYDESWVERIEQSSKIIIDDTLNYLKQLEPISGSTSISKVELFDKIKQAVVIFIIQTNYQQALQLLNRFLLLVQFSSQPSDLRALDDNKYVEFYFYQYITNIYHLVWFPLDDSSDKKDDGFVKATISASEFQGTKSTIVSASSFKTLDNIFKKVTFYYNKNEPLFMLEDYDDVQMSNELKYYWLVRWLNSTILFKQAKFHEFLKEFDLLIAAKSINNSNPLKMLFSETSILKSNILLILGISLIILKPFKSLSLIEKEENDVLVDLFNSVDYSFESFFYNEVLISLSESMLNKIKKVFNDDIFKTKFKGNLGFLLPVSTFGPSSSFLEYLNLLIDFKSFLLIISMIKQIPRLKLIQLLGYDDNIEKSSISNNLLLLISSLRLGELGIGYNCEADCFYNYEIEKNNKILVDEIDELSNSLQSESIANLMKGVLIEKFFS